ncbi:alpha/beta hydrolase [Kitasatospora sp. YST-16]|uniref:alpha/beta hydrolase n=1 Tax=Kitasatospora sp. YST-16 TaxID=2998080 RepID=UPI0022852699|nr:alpha/beta hydrolase [Kitasatospora sp. YST-16]WAL75552.1 alpha/beta hydrolase [Kitasatospora sp. YST-16]WNW41618.1 alpha/beta hydrolase [Streptomyces sp. Li-HN-5-13]
MPLHPQAEALRRQRAEAGTPPLYTRTLAEARAADLADIRAAAGNPEPVGSVEEFTVPGPGGPLPLRVYHPAPEAEAENAAAAPLPVLLYLFGGGWTLGSLDTGDAICRRLTNAVGCVTVAAGYRLAPEHPFPAAVHDVAAAAEWIAGHAAQLGADPARLAVAGDSAGGNLAAALTLLARERGGPAIRHQLLVYPNTDHRVPPPGTDDDPLLFNRRSVAWYWGHYLADPADGANPLASPLRAPSLAGLPPATVLTAEYDPLRDEGEQYAEALRAAGVPVELRRYDGMPHGFFAMSGVLDGGRDAQQHAAARLREALR